MNQKNQGAVLARRVAQELTIEEMNSVSGGIPPQTDWKRDHKGGDGTTGGQVLSTATNGGDSDYRQDM